MNIYSYLEVFAKFRVASLLVIFLLVGDFVLYYYLRADPNKFPKDKLSIIVLVLDIVTLVWESSISIYFLAMNLKDKNKHTTKFLVKKLKKLDFILETLPFYQSKDIGLLLLAHILGSLYFIYVGIGFLDVVDLLWSFAYFCTFLATIYLCLTAKIICLKLNQVIVLAETILPNRSLNKFYNAYATVTDIIDTYNAMYGPVMLLLIYHMLLYSSFSISYVIVDTLKPGLKAFVWIISIIIVQVPSMVMIMLCENISILGRNLCSCLCHKLEDSKLEKTHAKAIYLISKTQTDFLKITACGTFKVGRSCFLTLVGLQATYLITILENIY